MLLVREETEQISFFKLEESKTNRQVIIEKQRNNNIEIANEADKLIHNYGIEFVSDLANEVKSLTKIGFIEPAMVIAYLSKIFNEATLLSLIIAYETCKDYFKSAVVSCLT